MSERSVLRCWCCLPLAHPYTPPPPTLPPFPPPSTSVFPLFPAKPLLFHSSTPSWSFILPLPSISPSFTSFPNSLLQIPLPIPPIPSLPPPSTTSLPLPYISVLFHSLTSPPPHPLTPHPRTVSHFLTSSSIPLSFCCIKSSGIIFLQWLLIKSFDLTQSLHLRGHCESS